MRAAIVEAFGPFDGIRVKEIKAPSPAAGEILIRVSLAGVNFADGGMVSGRTPRRQPPFIPGVEAAGVVEAVGADVTDRRRGADEDHIRQRHGEAADTRLKGPIGACDRLRSSAELVSRPDADRLHVAAELRAAAHRAHHSIQQRKISCRISTDLSITSAWAVRAR
jgi:NADPH:quinone reductase-like Zn-dependent oxidoreductase